MKPTAVPMTRRIHWAGSGRATRVELEGTCGLGVEQGAATLGAAAASTAAGVGSHGRGRLPSRIVDGLDRWHRNTYAGRRPDLAGIDPPAVRL